MIKSEPRIETKVVGAEKSKENFVTYIVKVTAHIPPNLAVSWTVARRYEQFREFASMMEKKISKSKTALPKLTGKSVHASTQSLVSKRLKKLNAYLDELCRIPEVSHSHEWCCFLSSSFQDLFKIPMPAAYVASYSSYQSTEQPTSSSYQTDAFIEPSSLSSSVSEVGSYIGGPSSFMPSYLGSASTSSSGSSSASSASSPTSTSSSSSSTFSTTSTTSPPSPRLEKRPSISLDKPPVITKPPKKEGKDKDQLLQTIQELERKLDTQKTETRRALEQTSTVRRENEDLHQRVQQYSQRTHELESDIKQYVTEIRWVPDADRNTCPYCKTAFTIFYRRHHCRACGEVCCSKCSDTTHETLSRVCVGCREGTSITSRTRSQLGLRPLVPASRSPSLSASGRTYSASSQTRQTSTR